MYKTTIINLSTIGTALALVTLSVPAVATCLSDTDSEWEYIEVETSAGSGTYNNGTNLGLQGVGGNKSGSNPFTFQGPVSFNHWYSGSLNCTWTAEAYIGVDDAGSAPLTGLARLELVSLVSSGSGNCGRLTFGNLPLEAYDSNSATSPGLPGANAGDVYDQHGTTHTAVGELGSTGAGDRLEIYYDATLICDDSADLEFGNDVSNASKNDPSFLRIDTTASGWGGSCSVLGTATTSGFVDVNAW